MSELETLLRDVAETVERLERREATRDLKSQTGIPRQRKYTKEDAGWRLVTGRDPAALTAAEREQTTPLSVRTVERLLAAGVLQGLRIGGQTYVTEIAVQTYERYVAEGYVDGYQWARRPPHR